MTDSEPAGRILAVCSGRGGIPKHALAFAQVGPTGLIGDHHRYELHGGPLRALCLLSTQEVASLVRDGVRVSGPGALGENVLFEGIDPRSLRPGDGLILGDGVEIELTDIREPCATLRKLDPRFPDLMLGRSGFMARVLRGGLLSPGMPIARR